LAAQFAALCAMAAFGMRVKTTMLMSGHIFKIGFASQAKLKKQKNGGPKNNDQTAAGLHFSARHFSAAPVRVPCFYKCVLTSGQQWQIQRKNRRKAMSVMAESDKAKEIALRILTVLVGVLFVMTGGMKLINSSQTAGMFEHWGYPGWFGIVTGVIELVCGVLLFVTRFTAYAAAVLAVVMVGATITHLKAGETNSLVLPIVLLVIMSIIAVRRWKSARSK
jgi:putative oxidoreductase